MTALKEVQCVRDIMSNEGKDDEEGLPCGEGLMKIYEEFPAPLRNYLHGIGLVEDEDVGSCWYACHCGCNEDDGLIEPPPEALRGIPGAKVSLVWGWRPTTVDPRMERLKKLPQYAGFFR